MHTSWPRTAAALTIALAAVTSGLLGASPAGAATATPTATIAITPSVTTPAVGCVRVPVTFTVTGAKYWEAFIDSSQAMSDIHRVGDRSVESDAIFHCPSRDGVGTFAVGGTISFYDANYHYLGKKPISGRYTIVKTKPQVGINIRSGSPKVDRPVRLRQCVAVAGVKLTNQPITLTITPSTGTAQSIPLVTGRTGCVWYIGRFTRATTATVSFSTGVTSNLNVATTPPLKLVVTA